MDNVSLISDIIKQDWVAYADYDNRRAIPHVMDGLKITQRKVMYTALSIPKNERPLRVSQFSADVSKKTAYHHGEVSIQTTVVGLAQDFPGTNNFPYLQKHGQFGSRLNSAAASARYIFTHLHDNWNTFFKPEDQEIVEYLVDDGDQIEPRYYIPVLPTILLNGADGVGNGFSSKILTYNVKDLAKSIKEIAKYGKIKTKIIPFINNWNGTIDKVDKQIIITGTYEITNSTQIVISELPPDYDNEKYKKHLNKLIESGRIKDYKNHSTDEYWKWIISVPRSVTQLSKDDILQMFGLISKTTENFVCWGVDAISPITFDSPESLIQYWYDERIKLYDKSIKHQIRKCKDNIINADLKAKFIKWCLKNDFRKLTKRQFIEQVTAEIKKLSVDVAENLVSMPMYRITTDEVDKLYKSINELVDRLELLETYTPVDLMLENIKTFK